MSKNLPERYEAALATIGGQAALFEDSNQLLALTDAQLCHAAALYCDRTETGLAEMRRNFGLLAWAGWLRFEGAPYEQFVAALAKAADVHVRTVKAWRDSVVQKDDLAVPAATVQRQEEAKARENRRSEPVRAEKLHGTDLPIPVASTEAPKIPERPTPSGPTSAGGGPSSGTTPPPAGPNSTVAAPTIRGQLAHLFDHLADLDPTEAWEAMTTGQRELFRQWADIMRQATTVPPRVRPPVTQTRPVPLDRREVTPMFKKAR